MQPIVLILGGITLFLVVVHIVGGGKQIAKPMLAAEFHEVARKTMYVCWHAVTAQLLLSGVLLVWSGFGPPSEFSRLVLRGTALLFLMYAGLFLWIASSTKSKRPYLDLGQWIAFLPLGVLGFWASI